MEASGLAKNLAAPPRSSMPLLGRRRRAEAQPRSQEAIPASQLLVDAGST